MATAKQLPSGSWRCQVNAGTAPDGKRQSRSFTAYTTKQAEYAALEWQLHYREISRDSSNMTLAEAMERYLASKDSILSPSTVRGYDIIRRRHLQGLMQIRLNRLTPSMIQEAFNIESKPYTDSQGRVHMPTPKSVHNIHGFFSAVLREYHPALRLNITLPQKELNEQQYLEPEQVGKLLRAIKGSEMEVPILLALWLSLRSSEVTGLTWKYVDFTHNTITVRQARVRNKENQWVEKSTKTTCSTRTLHAPEYIMELLKASKGNDGPEDHVVKIKGNCLLQRLKTILRKNNLPLIRFHDLRHTNCSLMSALGVPERYMMARGGWSSPRVMRSVYDHTMRSKQNEVDQKIDRCFYQLMKEEDA